MGAAARVSAGVRIGLRVAPVGLFFGLIMRLRPDQVPDYPQSGLWADLLRWAVIVMDENDQYLPFIASVYAFCLKHDGRITAKQATAAERILARVHESWCADELACCKFDLESAQVGGSA